jgi:hypothetical protein
MYALKTYEQTGVYDPTDPTQRIREEYAGNPGRWASFYWNVVPTEGELRGLGAGWASIPNWGQIAIVGAIGAAAGYFGWSRYGAKLKPTLRKLPIVGGAFAGLGRGRARRRRR